MDLLLDAAKAWQILLDLEYSLIYGKSKKLYTVILGFTSEGFYHNAGFQYLDDISFPYMTSHPKTLDAVLSGKITQKMIQKSQNYQQLVEPRLKAIVSLQQLLENDFNTYRFNANTLPFYTEIQAKYLIAGATPNIVFLFTDTDSDDGHYFARSVFVRDFRDYTKNQTPMHLLKETRLTCSTGDIKLIYCKDGFEDKKTL